MPFKVFVFALSGMLAATALPSGRSPSAARAPAPVARMAQYRAYFARELTELRRRIDRQERIGLLRNGPATFMREDLTRIWIDLDRLAGRGAGLSPQEYASYRAMLRRVERRLGPEGLPPPRPLSRRTEAPAFRAAS